MKSCSVTRLLLVLLPLVLVAVSARPGDPAFYGSVAEAAALLDGPSAGADPAATEAVWHQAALRLATHGTPEALPALDRAAARKPEVLVEVPGCRRPVLVPAHPFPHAARVAAHAIRVREAGARFRDALTRKDGAYMQRVLSNSAPEDPEVLALRHELVTSAAARALAREAGLLEAKDVWSPARSRLAVAYWRGARLVPRTEEIRRLSDGAALELVTGWNADDREGRRLLLERAAGDPRLASLAVARGAGGDAAVDAFLRDHGSDAAFRLSRNRSVEMTGELAAAVRIDGVQRHAVLALMLQRTEEARAALENLLREGALDEDIASDVAGYLFR